MSLALGRKVQLLLAAAVTFLALVGVAGLVFASGLGGIIDEFVSEKVPRLQALSQLSTAVGRAAGAAAALENGSLEPAVHSSALAVVAGQMKVAEEASAGLAGDARDGDDGEQVGRALAEWRGGFDALTAAVRERAAAASFAEAANIQGRVTSSYEAVRTQGQALLERIDAAAAATRASAKALQERATSRRSVAWWGSLAAFLVATGVLSAVGLVLLRSIARSVRGLQAQAQALEAAVSAGALHERTDVSELDEEFRPVGIGMNAIVEAMQRPIALTVEYVTRISNGDVPQRITEELRGQFGDIRDAFNRCIDSLEGLIAAMARMEADQAKGDIDAFVPEDRFEGAFRTMAAGVNGGVRMHLRNMVDVMEVVGAYSRGDFEPVIRRFPGKQAAASEQVDLLRANLRAVAAEIQKMIASSLEGKLSTRADAAKFSGDWRSIVQGLNDMLEALVRPLDTAALCVEQIARGEIPARITSAFTGDFGRVRDNLNRCIDAVNALLQDASALAEAGANGELSRRADAARHQGDFRRIVEGVNRTLDGVIAPFHAAAVTLEQLARRDLTARVDGEYRGEHAHLKDSVNTMAEALHEAFAQVSQAVAQVSGAAGQIASSSQAVATGASEQAASLQETSGALESVAGIVQHSTASAQEASGLAVSARSAAAAGSGAVEALETAMRRIRQSSEGTGQIIKDVSEIAFQTNLLALNAAVEAARAGDAGRGFAVVAEEVRSLARRAKDAAGKTEELIRDAVRQAGEGETAANAVSARLTEIVQGVSKVTDIVGEIAASAREQASTIDQVSRAVAEMDRVTQQNAASAEESSSAAGELSGQAEELAAMVGSFRLDARSSGSARGQARNGAARNGTATPRPALPASKNPSRIAKHGDADVDPLREF